MVSVHSTTDLEHEDLFQRLAARLDVGPTVRVMHTGWYRSPLPFERDQLADGALWFVDGLERTLRRRGVSFDGPLRSSVPIAATDLWDAADLQGRYRGYPYLILARGGMHGHDVGDLSAFLEDPPVGELDLTSAVRLARLILEYGTETACTFVYFAPRCADRFYRGQVLDVLELLTGRDYPTGLEWWCADDLSWVAATDVDEMWTDITGPPKLIDAVMHDDRLQTLGTRSPS